MGFALLAWIAALAGLGSAPAYGQTATCVIIDARGTTVAYACARADASRERDESRKQRFRALRENAGREGEYHPPITDPWAPLEASRNPLARRPPATSSDQIRAEHRTTSQTRPDYARSGERLERPGDFEAATRPTPN